MTWRAPAPADPLAVVLEQRDRALANEASALEAAEAARIENIRLRSGLERLLANAEHIFDKQPVRDWDETLHEARAALASGDGELDPPQIGGEECHR